MIRRLLLIGIAIAVIIVGIGYRNALADPVVRRLTVRVSGLEVPVSVALVSDLHVAAPDMPPARLARIVAQINALDPDVVALAGDYTSDKALATARYTAAEAIAPLTALRPRIATVAVLGNHDHWRDAPGFRTAFAAAGITLLDNTALQVGPLAFAGVDDSHTGHADVEAALAATTGLRGPRVLLTHSPDVMPALGAQAADTPVVVLAGHMHCGQIVLPGWGGLASPSRYGWRYRCGVIRERATILIVTAGLGTSVVPLRYGAPPDLWLVTLVPALPPLASLR